MNENAEIITWEIARALHSTRGMESWDRIQYNTKKRWYRKAQDLIRECPSLRRFVWG